MKYSHIIWDWNGTLFNDAAWCMKVINKMLTRRGIAPFDDIFSYRDAFCFPVINYYKNAGFDLAKEPFGDLAKEFINLYHADKSGRCKLNDDSIFVHKSMHSAQIAQVILSASEVNNLLSQINEFDISHFFDEILGLSDIYAKSKIELGLDQIARNNAKAAVLIGNTVHDCEVAKALGVDCLLLAVGHQNRDRLLTCEVPVLDNLAQVLTYIH